MLALGLFFAMGLRPTGAQAQRQDQDDGPSGGPALTAHLTVLWLAGDYGYALFSTVTGWLQAVIVAAWNERGAENWARLVPTSIAAAIPAPIIAESPAMRRLLDLLDQVTRSDATVLIEGETGSGKELVARAIHAGSPRHAGPFVAVNCAAIPDSLAESELFGHERGAFTGALHGQPGWFEQAHGGTVFLDEVGETPLGVQAKLLRVLQEREVRRVGGSRTIPVDVRIVAATNQGLAGLVQARRFREDLYHRLYVVALRVPPLRERLEDLAPLAHHFLEMYTRRAGKVVAFCADAVARIRAQSWPGNVQELEHAVQRAVVLARGPEITSGDLGLDESTPWTRRPTPAPAVAPSPGPGPGARSGPPTPAVDETLSDLERGRILAALDRFHGNRGAAAQALGIDRSTLWRKLHRYKTLVTRGV